MALNICGSSPSEVREHAITTACAVDGWLTPIEAGALFDLAKAAQGPIVEIGSYLGRSTIVLALGSLAGSKQPVFAIDSFDAPMKSRRTCGGLGPRDASIGPDILRANLDLAGVNGLVNIIAKRSADAIGDIPNCGLLFVDGDHEYAAVSQDLHLYLPRVLVGGKAIFHDVTEGDPGVVQAIDEQVMSRPFDWLVHGRIGSAIIAERCRTVNRKIGLGFPGPNMPFEVAQNLFRGSLGAHEVFLYHSGNGWDDMEAVWVQALNAFESGQITHFAMLHSDVIPQPGWLDMLLNELETLKADLVSVCIPIKDGRGLTSCGIGDEANPWGTFRRFTVRELLNMPATFSIADTEYAERSDLYLLHNTGCWMCDLRNPLFFRTNDDGELMASFNFPVRARRVGGKWVKERESEDWYFSRQIHASGANTCITRKVSLVHRGNADFPNDRAWGRYMHGDEDTAKLWRKEPCPTSSS